MKNALKQTKVVDLTVGEARTVAISFAITFGILRFVNHVASGLINKQIDKHHLIERVDNFRLKFEKK
jgi:hypothetical protein